MTLTKEQIQETIEFLYYKLNNEFILTGSFADNCHIGWQTINDIDIYMISDSYIKIKNNIQEADMLYMKSFTGIKRNKGNTLHKFLYKSCPVDISVIEPCYGWRFGNIRKSMLEEQDLTIIEVNNKQYKIFSPIVRINQLQSHNYTKRNPQYEEKVAKAIDRVAKYAEMFNITAS